MYTEVKYIVLGIILRRSWRRPPLLQRPIPQSGSPEGQVASVGERGRPGLWPWYQRRKCQGTPDCRVFRQRLLATTLSRNLPISNLAVHQLRQLGGLEPIWEQVLWRQWGTLPINREEATICRLKARQPSHQLSWINISMMFQGWSWVESREGRWLRTGTIIIWSKAIYPSIILTWMLLAGKGWRTKRLVLAFSPRRATQICMSYTPACS